MGAHNRTVVCDFEESEGIGWSLSDSIGWIAYDFGISQDHVREMQYGINVTKIGCDRSGSGNAKSDGNFVDRIALDYVVAYSLRPSDSIKSCTQTPA